MDTRYSEALIVPKVWDMTPTGYQATVKRILIKTIDFYETGATERETIQGQGLSTVDSVSTVLSVRD